MDEFLICLDPATARFYDRIARSANLTTEQVPTFGMCTDISRFYTFVDGEFIEFYPDRRDVLRWDHLTEEMHRINGGKWQNTPYRHCD